MKFHSNAGGWEFQYLEAVDLLFKEDNLNFWTYFWWNYGIMYLDYKTAVQAVT